MRHSLTAQGYGVRLRPVQLEDAPFLVWLRNMDFAKGWVGDSAPSVVGQETWLNNYFEREGDYYFLVETFSGIPLGTNAIYNLREARGEIGRLVIRPGVSAGVPSCHLLLRLFYEQMGMIEVRAASVAGNYAIHSLLRKYEFRQVELEHSSRTIGGKAIDMLHFVQTLEDWPRAREKSKPKAQWAEARIRRWEEVYRQQYAQEIESGTG